MVLCQNQKSIWQNTSSAEHLNRRWVANNKSQPGLSSCSRFGVFFFLTVIHVNAATDKQEQKNRSCQCQFFAGVISGRLELEFDGMFSCRNFHRTQNEIRTHMRRWLGAVIDVGIPAFLIIYFRENSELV